MPCVFQAEIATPLSRTNLSGASGEAAEEQVVAMEADIQAQIPGVDPVIATYAQVTQKLHRVITTIWH